MYLDMPDMESFISELKLKKIREVRLVPFYRTIPSNPVAISSLSVILTTTFKGDIIRYEETIGREPSVFKEQLDALGKKAEAFMQKVIKELQSMKIAVRKGIFKYPSEMI